MQYLLIIIGVIIFIVIGYFLMGLIDRALVTNKHKKYHKKDESNDILIFTDIHNENSSFKIKEIIGGKRTKIFTNPEDYRLISSDILVAMSDSDLDNMSVCNAFKYFFPSIYTIAKCNTVIYEDIFKDVGVDVIIGNKNFEHELVQTIKGWHNA